MNKVIEKFKSINIFVYSGGKTGGTTIDTTLKKHGFQCIHVHSNEHFQHFLARSKLLTLNQLLQYASEHHEKIYIIDIYRNPIERSISSFFQNLKNHIPKHDAKYTVQDMITIFNKDKKYLLENYFPLYNIIEYFNLDCPTSFDFTKEYITIQHKNITILSLRFQSINKWGSILSEVFKKPITLIPDNVSEGKYYYNFYKKFLEKYAPPLEYLEEIKENRLFKFYNTEPEQKVYIEKWRLRLKSQDDKSHATASRTHTSE